MSFDFDGVLKFLATYSITSGTILGGIAIFIGAKVALKLLKFVVVLGLLCVAGYLLYANGIL